MKKNKIIFWTATILLILWEGLMPLGTVLFAPEYVNAGTKPLGYPDYFAYTLIICKILGVIAISYPALPGKVKEWAYAGFFFMMSGAALSHLAMDNLDEIFPSLLLLVLTIVSWYFRPASRKVILDFDQKENIARLITMLIFISIRLKSGRKNCGF